MILCCSSCYRDSHAVTALKYLSSAYTQLPFSLQSVWSVGILNTFSMCWKKSALGISTLNWAEDEFSSLSDVNCFFLSLSFVRLFIFILLRPSGGAVSRLSSAADGIAILQPSLPILQLPCCWQRPLRPIISKWLWCNIRETKRREDSQSRYLLDVWFCLCAVLCSMRDVLNTTLPKMHHPTCHLRHN